MVDYSSSSDSDPSEDSLPVAPELLLVSSFLCFDDSEADSESDPAKQRPERHESLAPSSEFPLAPVKMDDPNITIEEYIRLEEEKAKNVVRVSFNDSDDEDYTVIFDKNSFSYKIISVNYLKTDLENDNEKVNMPSFRPPEPTVSCFDDLDFFKDFENEFLAIVYNNAQTSKSYLLTKPILNPQHINEFNIKDETSLSECDEEEQNVLNFNDLFPFNVIYPNDSKSDKDNDDDKVDIEHSSGDLSVKPLPDVSIRRILGNGYGVSTSCTVLGPRERKNEDYCLRIVANLEIPEVFWILKLQAGCFNQ
ncbi:hypothetical protein Tco_0926450 [Tanacetum coccineum]|uniref:Uncharacterized protein n=1 Tax=Tanacetum coccineum TaxID=301880 RepID=A0ABQ5DCS9_9ASTR